MRHVIEIELDGEYIPQLKARMDAAGVSQNALAEEMGRSASQVSRWFTESERRVDMTMNTAMEVERALIRILDKRAAKKTKTGKEKRRVL